MDTKYDRESLSPHQVTPSDTTVTLPTPDPAHLQLPCPPRFIFYPISWDGSEVQDQKMPHDVARSDDCVDDDPSSAVFCSADAFWSIDRWRRDVVECGGSTSHLLDPIQDADTPLPLLSLPHDHYEDVQPAKTRTDGSGSESDSVQLWIHP